MVQQLTIYIHIRRRVVNLTFLFKESRNPLYLLLQVFKKLTKVDKMMQIVRQSYYRVIAKHFNQ